MPDRADLYGAVSRLEARAEVPDDAADALWGRLEGSFPDLAEVPVLRHVHSTDLPHHAPRRVATPRRRWSLRVAVTVATAVAVAAAALGVTRLVDGNEGRRTTVLNEPTVTTALPSIAPTTTSLPAITGPEAPGADRWESIDPGPLLDFATLLPAVWTGSEMVVFGTATRPRSGQVLRQDQGAAYDPATGRWRLLPAEPLDRPSFDTVVWTGREVVLWGGSTPTSSVVPTYEASGAAYDPRTDSWRVIAPAPAAAMRPEAVWTGSEMIVFGGESVVAGPSVANPGYAYDPAKDTWRTIARAPVDGCGCYRAIWAGTEMIAMSQNGTKALPMIAYEPASDTWRTLPASPLEPRSDPALVWTGRELLQWGGVSGDGRSLSDGAAYDPGADTWRRLPDAPIPGRILPVAAWTGGAMLVVGGYADADLRTSGWLDDGAMYSPTADRWIRTANGSLPTLSKLRGAYQYKWAWTGSQVVLAGGIGIFDADKRAAATYRP